MLYFIKFENGKYLDWTTKSITTDLSLARFFKSEETARRFTKTMPQVFRKCGVEIRVCPEVSKCLSIGRVVYDGRALSDNPCDSISPVAYGEAKPDGKTIVTTVIQTDVKKEFEDYISRLNKKLETLSSQISDYDKKQQDILHCVELVSIDAVKRVKLMNALIDIRKKRRECKEEFGQVSSILNGISKIKLTEVRDFEYSCNLVPDILGK